MADYTSLFVLISEVSTVKPEDILFADTGQADGQERNILGSLDFAMEFCLLGDKSKPIIGQSLTEDE
eukprot:11379109-Ditylum_brightwellii.AAC.1